MSTGTITTHSAEVTWRGGKEDLRAHEVRVADQVLAGSCQPEFGGDPSKADPEELLVAALSACHMLWFLDFSRRERLRVAGYRDRAEGTMDGTRFTRVVLRPRVEWEGEAPDAALVDELHHRAHQACFIANTVTCPVEVAYR